MESVTGHYSEGHAKGISSKKGRVSWCFCKVNYKFTLRECLKPVKLGSELHRTIKQTECILFHIILKKAFYISFKVYQMGDTNWALIVILWFTLFEYIQIF